jgi:hypothetical protein
MLTIALVAAKDAEASIGDTVRSLAALVGVDEVWVVDDGSTDATGTEAARAGARVVTLADNRGKGGALTAGVEATPHADRYLLADADLGATAAGLQALLDAPGSPLTVGVLPAAGRRGGFGGVKRLARAGIARACGVALDAPLSGQRLIEGDLLRSLTLAPRFGVEVGMTIDAVRAGASVREIPVEVDHRHTGRSLAGFRHRGRQGRDIVAALIPRLASVRQRCLAIVATGVAVVMLLTGLSLLTAPPRGAALPQADKVVIFGFDHLSLGDLRRSDLPGLRGLARDGVVGALSVRTTDRRSLDRRTGPERPSPLDAYASLGASARVRANPSLGVAPGQNAPAMRAARRLARHDKAASLPGALGDQLRRFHERTALVGGAQLVDGSATAGFPAAAALADSAGRIGRVDTAPGLLEATSLGGAGLRASIPAFVVATGLAVRDADVVVVDPGETARAFDAGGNRTAALRRTDAILAGVRGVLPARTLLLVVSPTPRGTDWELTPVVAFHSDMRPGKIESPATRRDGLGVITDIAPTVLHSLGHAAPAAMTGSPLRAAPGRLDVGAYERMTSDGGARNRFFLGAAVGYTVAAIALYLILAGALIAGLGATWRTPLRVAVYAAAAFAPVLLFTGALQHWMHVGGESPVVLVLSCLAVGAVCARGRGLRPVYWCAAFAAAVIALDVATTGPVHTSSLLGYTIQTSGRFYGLPNASFSVFATSVVLLAIAVAGGWRTRRSVARAVAGATVLGVGCVVVAAPWLGNDVGGTLALVPVSAALAWVFSGRRVDRRVALFGAAAIAVALGLVLGLEAVLGSSSHLSRALGGGSVSTTLAHRVDANVGLLVDQWWGFLLFALVAAALVVIGRGHGTDELPIGSPLRAGVVGALVLSVLAFVGNDSGPVVSVLCVVVVAPVLALRAIDADRLRRSRR